jgi:putative transposase
LPLPIYTEGRVFFVTAATRDRAPWFAQFPELARILADIVDRTAAERGAELFAWCVMPDHCHLLVRDDALIAFVRLVKGRLTPAARSVLPLGASLWQRSFHDHALRKEESVNAVAEYIFENPVRHGLSRSPEEYAWSGSRVWPNWREFFGGG